MATQFDRPSFFEGQYLGAADMAAVVDYARNLSREHALGGHAWGIAIGLELAELPAQAGGGIDLFVMPGFAWDGYGRAIVVLDPVQVPIDLFTGLPSGNQQLWIRYAETPFRGLRQGFETCGTDEAYSRVRESFALEAGPFANIGDRQGGVTYAGQAVDDARLAARSLSDTAPLMCDASIPQQTFPIDTARWLVPLGVANWVTGSPGGFAARTADALKLSRTLRQGAGTIAENLFAADGVIRLRDRFAQFKGGDSADLICDADRIGVDDLTDEIDRDNSTQTTGRLVGNELVWVEGNMRATGQVRLFGTRLELRDAAGLESKDVPLFARRAVSPDNPAAGQDFQIVIGADSKGADRLSVGPAKTNYGDIEERFIVRTDGVIAAGQPIPSNLGTNAATICKPDTVTLGLATNADKTAKLSFQTLPGLAENAHVAYDGTTKTLRVTVGPDQATATTFTTGGNVGIRMPDPASVLDGGDDLVVRNLTGGVGVTLLCSASHDGALRFSRDPASLAGFVAYGHAANRLRFGTAGVLRATLDSAGSLGLGIDTPTARVDIRDGANALLLNGASIETQQGGAVGRLELQPAGGGFRVHGNIASASHLAFNTAGQFGIGIDTPAASIHVAQVAPELRLDSSGGGGVINFAQNGAVRSSLRYSQNTGRTTVTNNGFTALTVDDGRVGINLGSDAPANVLHVRGAINGNATFPTSHVVLFENTAGSDADVLALRLPNATASVSNNFITFFDSSGPIGRIEQSTTLSSNPSSGGSFLRLISGAADFAEALPRAADEVIGPGRIVGVRGGRVSLDTAGADALLVTTDRAVVVGNVFAGSEHLSETVALIGQVPVRIDGAAEPGDFVLPSGKHDGIGRAVAADALRCDELSQVVGRIWRDDGAGLYTIAVGLNGSNAVTVLADRLARQERRIDALVAALGIEAPQ